MQRKSRQTHAQCVLHIQRRRYGLWNDKQKSKVCQYEQKQNDDDLASNYH